MKPKSPLWRITHYPVGAASSTGYVDQPVRLPKTRYSHPNSPWLSSKYQGEEEVA